MKSTPAVFCAPSVSAMSTPCISTPAVFQQESYPWAVKTPEPSPMVMGVAPFCAVHGMEVPAPQPMISRELIRSVCEPFFEQMITALQVALQEQQRRIPQTQQTGAQATRDMFQSVFSSNMPMMHHRTQLDPMPDDESTTDEVGAFASLLSGPASEGEVFDFSEASPQDSEASSPALHIPSPQEDSEPSDLEKSVMVCRHWRSKGWCRMEANCKFLHPENKRGVTAPKAGKGCATSVSTTALSLSDMIGLDGVPEPLSLPRRRKRGGRGKSSRTQMEDAAILEPGQVVQTASSSQSGEDR